jgi:hypothetical protein
LTKTPEQQSDSQWPLHMPDNQHDNQQPEPSHDDESEKFQPSSNQQVSATECETLAGHNLQSAVPLSYESELRCPIQLAHAVLRNECHMPTPSYNTGNDTSHVQELLTVEVLATDEQVSHPCCSQQYDQSASCQPKNAENHESFSPTSADQNVIVISQTCHIRAFFNIQTGGAMAPPITRLGPPQSAYSAHPI